MRREFVDIANTAGKTVKSVHRDYANSGIVIVFSDESYSWITVREGYENSDLETNEPVYGDIAKSVMIAAGLMTQADSDEIDRKQEEECAHWQKEIARLDYERWKAKCG